VDYKRAGIQTWMLTGDKGKTAKMIGLQCGMFSAGELSPQRESSPHQSSSKTENEIVEDVIANKSRAQNLTRHQRETLLHEVNE